MQVNLLGGMMLYKYEHKPISRAKPGGGRKSAVACAAYRAGEKLTDSATGKIYDYTQKQGIAHNAIIGPEGEEIPDRATLWNMADKAEKRADARIGREIIAALDPDLTLNQNIEICDRHAKKLADKYGCIVDYSIHAPPKNGDPRNWHVHYFLTTRKFENGQFTEKTQLERSDKALAKAGKPSGRAQITALRIDWQDEVNAALQRAGKDYRIDARSYQAQGKNIMPGVHLGPDDTRAERGGEHTERGDYNRLVAAINAAQRELERREKEAQRPTPATATISPTAPTPPPADKPRRLRLSAFSDDFLTGPPAQDTAQDKAEDKKADQRPSAFRADGPTKPAKIDPTAPGEGYAARKAARLAAQAAQEQPPPARKADGPAAKVEDRTLAQTANSPPTPTQAQRQEPPARPAPAALADEREALISHAIAAAARGGGATERNPHYRLAPAALRQLISAAAAAPGSEKRAAVGAALDAQAPAIRRALPGSVAAYVRDAQAAGIRPLDTASAVAVAKAPEKEAEKEATPRPQRRDGGIER